MRSPNHQPGEAEFRSILPEDIIWKPYPGFPTGVHNAVVVGDPTKPGPYTIRVKVPAGVKLMPHKHPEDRVYTVISGVFYIGLQAYPTGSVVVLPGNTHHFQQNLACCRQGTTGRCLLVAQSGHPNALNRCPLSGVKRTCRRPNAMSAFDP